MKVSQYKHKESSKPTLTLNNGVPSDERGAI